MEYEFQYIKNKNKILELGPSGASMIFTPSSFGGMQKINEVGHSVFNFMDTNMMVFI